MSDVLFHVAYHLENKLIIIIIEKRERKMLLIVDTQFRDSAHKPLGPKIIMRLSMCWLENEFLIALKSVRRFV